MELRYGSFPLDGDRWLISHDGARNRNAATLVTVAFDTLGTTRFDTAWFDDR